MSFLVTYTKSSQGDLQRLTSYIAGQSSLQIAEEYVGKLIDTCDSLGDLSHRGTKRTDLKPGIRTTGFRNRVTIVFEVFEEKQAVVILRILYGGRSLEKALSRL